MKQKKLSFTTKQWIIIIAAVILGVCMSDLDDYLYRHNDAFRYVLLDKKVLIGDHHIEGARYGLKFALAAVIMNIIYRIEYEPQKRKLGTAMRRVRKYIGFIGLVFFTLILWLISWLDGLALQPDSNYVFYVYFILYILLRKEKRPYWVMTLSIFVIMGVFFCSLATISIMFLCLQQKTLLKNLMNIGIHIKFQGYGLADTDSIAVEGLLHGPQYLVA